MFWIRGTVDLQAVGCTERMKCGMLPSSEMICRRETASVLPTMSLMRVGRYFSTYIHQESLTQQMVMPCKLTVHIES